MNNIGKLAGKTVFVTGSSRGIGKAIALKAASDGANVVIAAKTAELHPKLEGTIYTAAEEARVAGGKALACICDIRDEAQVKAAVKKTVETFGGIDILVNNATAINLASVEDTDMKRYDLMSQVNARGTFLVTKECLPYLKKSSHAHILILTPPLVLNPEFIQNSIAYTITKYGMGLCMLGMSAEFKKYGIGVNGLWPKAVVWTAAVKNFRGDELEKFSRKPDIMGDAAYAIFCKDPKLFTGNFLFDEILLKKEGVIDMKQYACDPENSDKIISLFSKYEDVIGKL